MNVQTAETQFVIPAGPNASLQATTVRELLADEVDRMVIRGVGDQVIANQAGMVEPECECQPAETRVAKE